MQSLWTGSLLNLLHLSKTARQGSRYEALAAAYTEAGETEVKETTTSVQRQLALWTAGIFTLLGVVFLVFSLYNVFILQQGHVDPSDTDPHTGHDLDDVAG